eukprot:scaffold661489_cov60-Prasinocladus_malaysianus.AAC.1
MPKLASEKEAFVSMLPWRVTAPPEGKDAVSDGGLAGTMLGQQASWLSSKHPSMTDCAIWRERRK